MIEDNTPTVTARRREKSSKQRLRAQLAKKIPDVASRIERKKQRDHRREEAKAEYDARRAREEAKRKEREEEVDIQAEKGDKDEDRLAVPKPSIGKHKKRQMNKSWLPTHLFHTKRAHMTPPKEPLWRFSIPLTPTQKNYRIAHRASTLRGCIAWEMSYQSTIGLEGQEESILGTFRDLGVENAWLVGIKGVRWRNGERSFQGWVREAGGKHAWIAKVAIIWEPKAVGLSKRRVLVRVQPAAFLQLWEELLKAAKNQRPQTMLEDLRFEIGSIDITGPASMEALVGILRPTQLPSEDASDGLGNITDTWAKMAPVTDSFALPTGAILASSVSDPRLGAPHRTLEKPQLTPSEATLQLTSEWPAKATYATPSIFDRKLRLNAVRHLSSQRSINRRKGEAPPGEHPSPVPTDPCIPLLLMANNHDKRGFAQGSWTLLLPWKCVLPVWYPLMHYPLSSGGNPRFGGLSEQRQMHFENNKPWFPADFPGTRSGWLWEMQERAKRKREWERKPKGRRIEFDSLDLGQGRKGEIGRGWACDWERLFSVDSVEPQQSVPENEADDNVGAQAKTSNPPQISSNMPPSEICHLTNPTRSLDSTQSRALATVSVTLLHRGVPTPCARVYRLPTQNADLRSIWLSLTSSLSPPNRGPVANACNKSSNRKELLTHKPHPAVPTTDSVQSHRPALAAALLSNKGWDPPQAGDSDYPVVPDEEDLIGFVTTGNFNLGEGKGTGVGCVVWQKVLESGSVEKSAGKGKAGGEEELGGWCIVREAGSGIGRIGKWKVVG